MEVGAAMARGVDGDEKGEGRREGRTEGIGWFGDEDRVI